MTEKRQEKPVESAPELFPDETDHDERDNSEEFDWSGRDVVIERQPRTAIYRNAHGHVVIRQEVGWPEDDTWVTIDPRHLPDVIDWLQDIYDKS